MKHIQQRAKRWYIVDLAGKARAGAHDSDADMGRTHDGEGRVAKYAAPAAPSADQRTQGRHRPRVSHRKGSPVANVPALVKEKPTAAFDLLPAVWPTGQGLT